MTKKLTITRFIEADTPVTAHVTKFGGQPVWLTEPQWPISRSTGVPMQFICQIALDPAIFGEHMAGKMAYVFMTDEEITEEGYVDGTWESDSGENAVIIQPDGVLSVEVKPIYDGPTLYEEQRSWTVEVQANEDPDDFEDVDWGEEDAEESGYDAALDENKIGGSPMFLQSPEYPDSDHQWRLLLQLNSTSPQNAIPFDIVFGDLGIAYAFISTDGMHGGFLWQCS